MLAYYGKRQSGKTTALIKKSADNNIPIITWSDSDVGRIIKMAFEMGLNIPKPITYSDFISDIMMKRTKPHLLDDLNSFLDRLNIRFVTIDEENLVKIPDNKPRYYYSDCYKGKDTKVMINDETECKPKASIADNIEKVIFNDPATIILWKDGSEKTVVKCSENDEYDPYFGFCAAITKKIFGSNQKIKNIVEKYAPEEENIFSAIQKLGERMQTIFTIQKPKPIVTHYDIFSQFLKTTAIDKDMISDYRPCYPPYNDDVINNAIVVWLKNGTKMIYIYDEKKR